MRKQKRQNATRVGGSPRSALSFSLSALFSLVLTAAIGPGAQAGDLLRGGAAANSQRPLQTAKSKVDAQAGQISSNANDSLARTTQAVESVRRLQESARQLAIGRGTAVTLQGLNLPAVPNGLRAGGLEVDPEVALDRSLWKGARLPVEAAVGGRVQVSIQQLEQSAILNWKTFNVGKNTTVEFRQSPGGDRKAEWIAFNKINDPAGRPSQILGSIKAEGQVYIINRNGIIFGGASQVNVHTLVASSLPINDNLVKQGLLNNRDAQFLFSALPVPTGTDGTPAFNPTINDPEFQVAAGADTYTLRDKLALDSTSTPLQVGFSYVTPAGKRAALLVGTDYTLTVDAATKKGTATFTPAGLLKLAGASVKATYTPEVVKTGDLIVQAGAKLTSPVNAEGSGGRLMLVGTNVTNAGSLSSEAGQTIMAAGLQVGIVGHATTDPSLRGLDVSVGAVGENGGTVTHSGLIESFRGSTTIVGRNINQMGVIDSTTAVDLNGRIDLLASYNSVGNPSFDNGGAGGPPFLPQNTGTVVFGAGSVTRILPDYASEEAVPGTELPERSQINVEGKAINFRANSIMQAPSGEVTIRAGTWPYKDTDGNRTTFLADGTADPGLGSYLNSGLQKFLFNSGQIYLDPAALITVAGSTDVFVPLSHSILEVSFRGAELADSPLQRTGVLRNVPLTVDLRRTGAYDGRFWMGTPLGDATGLAGLIERNAAQLTAKGGTVTMQAGDSIVLREGATIDVSGGFFRHEAGMVKTTRLVQGGRLVDIADAVPDQVYDRIFTGEFTRTSGRWGINETYTIPFMKAEHFEPSYVEGAAGGTITLTAPGMAIDGTLRGQTVEGDRQRALPPTTSSLSFRFAAEKQVQVSPTSVSFLGTSPTPPAISFADLVLQPPVPAFRLVGDTAVGLPAERTEAVILPTRLVSEQGFGNLTIENTEGTITVSEGVALDAPALGSLNFTARNLAVEGRVSAPGGSLTFVALNRSKIFVDDFLFANAAKPILNAPGQGTFLLSSGAELTTEGLTIDDRLGVPDAFSQPLVLAGGKISISAYDARLEAGSTIDVSGGVRVSERGVVTYGNGGEITIRAGKDPGNAPSIDGTLLLASTLNGYSGTRGGSLSIRAGAIQIGGHHGSENLLVLQPEFFRQGGFTSYALEGIGALLGARVPRERVGTYVPGISILPGVVLEPVAESLLAIPISPGANGVTLTQILKPAGQRAATSISFRAIGDDNVFPPDDFLEARGDVLMGAGARIVVDPGATVGFQGDTVTILGSVSAPGGRITVAGGSRFRIKEGNPITFGRPTVYLGPQSHLSTAGTAIYVPDAFGRRLGTIFPGGTITVSGNIVADNGSVLDVSGASAIFDLHPNQLGLVETPIVPVNSGVTDSLWRTRSVPVQIDSDGGTITLAGSEMLYSDATLLGRAGGPTAIGGTLSISSGRYYTSGADRTSADINLIVTQGGSQISTFYRERGVGLRVGNETGIGHFAANRFALGGFQSLDLGAATGNIRFSGPVSITAPGYLRVAGGGVIEANAKVSLQGAYVAVGQPFLAPTDPVVAPPFPFTLNGAIEFPVAPTSGPGVLTVKGDFIDAGNLSLQNIGSASLIAEGGDIRGNGTLSLAGNLRLRAGQIYPTTVGDFTIVAYDKTVAVAASTFGNPQVTLASATLPFGFGVGSPLLGSTVQNVNGTTITLAAGANATIAAETAVPFARSSVTVNSSGRPSAPLSAGGNLSIFASKITQDGTLLAPFGTITLGWDGTDFNPADADLDQPFDPLARGRLRVPITSQLVLKGGSLTSVAGVDYGSSREMLIPFGLSTDGLTWIDPSGLNVTVNGLPQKTVALAGENVTTRKGSQIDIRGGGDLYAYRWIPGPGGSVDLTGEASSPWTPGAEYQPGALVTFGGKTYSARVRHQDQTPAISLFWTEVPESYAIVPGYTAPTAPFLRYSTATNFDGDPGYFSATLKVGDQIYLNATPELDAGRYTLLPRRYALLPGAFLVTPTSAAARGTISLVDGSTLVPGYDLNSFVQPLAQSPVLSQFKLLTFDELRNRAEYDDYFGNSFFKAAAERVDLDQPQELPIDAGYLSLHGNVGLRPEGNVLAQRPSGGRGATVDLSSFNDIYITGGTGTAPAGATAILRTSVLNSWGIESLLIGGLRRDGATGTIVDVRAKTITLNNPKDVFHGPEIVLAANEGLTLAPGSALGQSLRLSRPGETLLPTGTFRLDATGDALDFVAGGAPIRFPNGTPGDNRVRTSVAATITLANGSTQALAANTAVTLAAGSSLTLSAPGAVTFDSGNSGPIPIAMGDGVLLRVTGDPIASIVRSGLASAKAPTLAIGAGARVSGPNVNVDSTYGTLLDPAASLRAQYLTLGSGQISILLEPTAVLTGSVVDPHLVLSGQVLEDVQKGKTLTLTSYRTIDFYGSGTFGGALSGLTLRGGGVRGYNQGAGSVTLSANSLLFDNPTNVATLAAPAAPASGSFNADVGTLRFGSNAFSVTGYSDLNFDASGGVFAQGVGSFSTPANLTITTPIITGARNSTHQITADGDLKLEAAPGKGAVQGGLGASYVFTGRSVVANTRIILPSGQITLRTTGTTANDDITVGGTLDVSGTEQAFFDLIRYSGGGNITLNSRAGDVTLTADSTVSVAAPAGGGNAGTVTINAPQGVFASTGAKLLGSAAIGQRTGSFLIDAGSVASFDDLSAELNTGGFFETRNVRVRVGDITIGNPGGTANVAREYIVSTDTGNITLAGTIDASWRRGLSADDTDLIALEDRIGGKISLIAGGNLTITSGAVLDASAEVFSSAGKGGSIVLEAGTSTNGVVNQSAVLTLEGGSTIELGVADYVSEASLPGGVDDGVLNDYLVPGTSAFAGRFQGTLHLRAPRTGLAANGTGAGSGISISAIGSQINGASSVLAEGYKTYLVTGADGTISAATQTLIRTEGQSYLGASGATVANYTNMFNSLVGGQTLEVQSVFVLAPGAEIVNVNGNVTLGASNSTSTSDWSLSSTNAATDFRFGPNRAAGVLTIRASQNLVFFNTLSDGFMPVASNATSGNSTMWLAPLRDLNAALPINTQSWSFRLAAGSDVTAADFTRVRPLEDLASGVGSVLVGKQFTVPNNPQDRTSAVLGAAGRGFQVIRTGAGHIDIAAGRDVQLRNQFSTIYTAGVALPTAAVRSMFTPNDFVQPNTTPLDADGNPIAGYDQLLQASLGPAQQRYLAQWSMGGGDVTISAQGDIRRSVATESSSQLPMNWLYRRGLVDPTTGLFAGGDLVNNLDPATNVFDAAASTAWWVDFSNFFEGFGTFGGGNVTMRAGNDVLNVDAVAATNARMAGRFQNPDGTFTLLAPDPNKLVELGGGDVVVRAGRNIDGGVFYVERGEGRLFADGAITTNSSRSTTVAGNPLTWLPTTLFLGKGNFDVGARGDVLLGPVVNPFMLPQGLNNRFWYKSYFDTYSPDSSLDVVSFGGSVTHRLAATDGGSAREPILNLWLRNRSLRIGSNLAISQPWIRLGETTPIAIDTFRTPATVLPPTVRSTAFAGDVNVVGEMNLFPAPLGTLELAASGAIVGLQPVGVNGLFTRWSAGTINVSDADPARIYGITTPLGYQNLVGPNRGALIGGASNFISPMTDIDSLFAETGVFSGSGATFEIQDALHAKGPLHADDPSPVRIYAVGGDVTGFTLFTPKTTRVIASNDVTDVAFYIQNVAGGDISLVSAGRDVIPFNENGALRTLASDGVRNVIADPAQATVAGTSTTGLPGDLQISGPGVLEVFAGRNLDLGNGANISGGTGLGIVSIGNARNPTLPLEGADIIALAGVGGSAKAQPALGLTESSLQFDEAGTGEISAEARKESRYLTKLKLKAGSDDLTEEQKAIVALEEFFRTLRDSGRAAATSGSGDYSDGLAAIEALFGGGKPRGEIFTRARDVRTTTGGAITMLVPGGGVTLASDIFGNPLTPPGIVTEFGGPISIFTDGSVDIGQARIFTLRGGDIVMWSSNGNIAAGNAPRTVVTAPPTRVVIDGTSALVKTDLGGLATGGGIGVLASVKNVPPGDVDLIAVTGFVDAGDAGIRSTGNLTIAATTVLNAGNIQVGGSSSGVPSVAAPAAPVLTSAPPPPPPPSNSTPQEELAKQQREQASEEVPSIITVELLSVAESDV